MRRPDQPPNAVPRPRYAAMALFVAISAVPACDRSARTQPAPPASSTLAAPEAPSPFATLLALGRIFSDPDAPEVCDEGARPHVLVASGADDTRLLALATRSGCRVLEGTESDSVRGPFPGRPLCCPVALAGAPALATGGGKSCARALIDRVTVTDPEAEASPASRPGAGEATLNAGTFLAECDVPESAQVVLCVAAARGRAQGVSVAMVPFDRPKAECVGARVRTLRLDPGESTRVTITHFAPEPRR